MVAALSTAGTIIFAVAKPPIAKFSNVIGRGYTYLLSISFYVLSYIIMASAKTINTYAAGIVFYNVGQSGTNILNDIVMSDITTARWRALGLSLLFLPFLVMPWVGALIVESVVKPGGIGWRWGIGMLAILMPFCASFIIVTMLYFERKAKRMNLIPRVKMTVYRFCSQIDLGGVFLFAAGFALFLLPMTLASTSPSQWQTPWLIALIIVGGLLLIGLAVYEHFLAAHPIMPAHYFRNLTIVLCCILVTGDSLGMQCTHTYLYAWATVAHNMNARDATFYFYTNGVTQSLSGIMGGLFMAYFRRYKHLAIAGAVVRLVGYGVMIRLRGAQNGYAELFIVQLIQGLGSGIIQNSLLVPVQVSVPHAEMAQATALVVSFSVVGSSIGSCIAGGIYTNTFKSRLWYHLGDRGSVSLVSHLFNSITTGVPAWGTPERTAINFAYTDVMRYMTYTAVGSTAPAVILTWLMPNHRLPYVEVHISFQREVVDADLNDIGIGTTSLSSDLC